MVNNKFKKVLTYEELKDYTQSQKFQKRSEYYMWSKGRTLIPFHPNIIYSEQWESWGKFLGTGNISPINKNKQFIPFKKSQYYIQKFNLKTKEEYVRWSKTMKRPDFIPTRPEVTYKKNWISWKDFLGTNKINCGSK